ncbi:hypothetical protein L226DRAFT_214017 [Lentinus tigrinus ALCF2SS1-7]|uniref:uncharacterized protein n=1 Tax=Lentinus tigrinus ALCF2SS1-7 TaxID=1328758 RepID=UPI001165FB53|nr:hypothetical protein L226DRAFT_214017 [Lentinus tigrinus ALCF2SS1-7]
MGLRRLATAAHGHRTANGTCAIYHSPILGLGLGPWVWFAPLRLWRPRKVTAYRRWRILQSTPLAGHWLSAVRRKTFRITGDDQ